MVRSGRASSLIRIRRFTNNNHWLVGCSSQSRTQGTFTIYPLTIVAYGGNEEHMQHGGTVAQGYLVVDWAVGTSLHRWKRDISYNTHSIYYLPAPSRPNINLAFFEEMAPTEVPSKLPGNTALEHHDPVLFDLIEKEKVSGYRPSCGAKMIDRRPCVQDHIVNLGSDTICASLPVGAYHSPSPGSRPVYLVQGVWSASVFFVFSLFQ